MTWARLDDRFWTNRKLRNVSLAARGLYASAISYSADNLTDGLLTPEDLASLWAAVDTGKNGGNGTLAKLTAELVRANLLELDDEGHHIHDYLTYNPSREQVARKRADARDRMQRLRSPEVRANSPRTFAPRSHTPVPARPVTTDSPGSREQNANTPPERLSVARLRKAVDQLAPPPPSPTPEHPAQAQPAEPEPDAPLW